LSFKRRLASFGLAGALAGSLLATLASPVFATSGPDQTAFLDCGVAADTTSCSQIADGISTVTLQGDNGANATVGHGLVAPGDSLYIQLVGGGTIISVGGSKFTLAGGAVSYTNTTNGNVQLSPSDTITIRGPSAPGTSTVNVYYITGANGTAALEGTLTITWTATSGLVVSEGNSTVAIRPWNTNILTSCSGANTISSASASPAATDVAALCLTLKDANGTALPNGISVAVTITPVGLVSANGTTYGQTVSGATSGGTGTANFAIRSTGLSGVATISISVTQSIGGNTVTTTFAPRTFTFTGPVSSITLTNVSYAIATGNTVSGAAKFVAKDAAGHQVPTSGSTVATSSGAPFTAAIGSEATSSAAGTVDVSCGATPGTGTLTVTSGAVTSNAITIVCSDSTPDSFTVAFDKTTVAPGGTATFTITVKDANGLPVPDGTSTTAVTNGGALVGGIISGPSATSDTSNGVATYTLVAPNTTGVVTVTAVVDSLATQSASITVGAPVSVTATAGTALGVTTSGPFSTTTKVQALGKYVTWKFSFGAAGAGQTVEIWRAVKQADGTWSGFTLLTKRVANSNGDVFFYWRSSSATWISVRGKLGTTYTPALQARWK
jgi:hypothetical protein